jgi:hypothetical protein
LGSSVAKRRPATIGCIRAPFFEEESPRRIAQLRTIAQQLCRSRARHRRWVLEIDARAQNSAGSVYVPSTSRSTSQTSCSVQ